MTERRSSTPDALADPDAAGREPTRRDVLAGSVAAFGFCAIGAGKAKAGAQADGRGSWDDGTFWDDGIGWTD